MQFLYLFALFAFAHALADYPLQGDFLAKAKSRANPIPGVPWWQAMGAHVIIHAGFVLIISSMMGGAGLGLALLLAAIEAAIHAVTDDAKCCGQIGFNTDQATHLLCKAAYAFVLVTA